MSNSTNIHLDISKSVDVNQKQLKCMVFVMNAIEKGWAVKKQGDEYIFTKKHEGKREIFRENYLETFIQTNFNMDILKNNWTPLTTARNMQPCFTIISQVHIINELKYWNFDWLSSSPKLFSNIFKNSIG